MGKKLEFIAEKSERVVSFLSSNVAGLSRAKADILIKSGEVRINGAKVKSNAELQVGDRITAFIPDDLQDSRANAHTIYDDDNIVVFDKPKRMAYDALPAVYGAPLFAVHRLDTNTTGVIVFAKTENALAELAAAFKERRVKKVYEAVVMPPPPCDRATLTAYTKLASSIGVAAVSAKPQTGYKTMITEYETIKRVGGAALLRVYPHTGRTHQIRAHFAFAGFPIVGEHKYGIKGSAKLAGAPDSQMLAAVELTFFGLANGLEYLNLKTFAADSKFDLSFLVQADD